MNERTEQKDFLVQGEKKKLVDEPWDILIILDACRYDAFRKYYTTYLPKAILKKAISPATNTKQFLYKSFRKKTEDIIYISGNMFINSKGIPIKLFGGKIQWDGKDYFKKIIDVWDTGFSREYDTILPKEINKNAVVQMDIEQNKRFVLHYMQPHAPFITWGEKKTGIKRKKGREKNIAKIKNKILNFTYNHISESIIWKTANIFGILPEGGCGDLYIKKGKEGYRKHYENNLEIALYHVNNIIKKYPSKKILIIGDHGERLGENGNFRHTKPQLRDKAITEVPWCVVGYENK